MKVYEFEIGIMTRKRVCVLAHNEIEACRLISRKYERDIDKRFIAKTYDYPQVIIEISEGM